MTVAVCDVAPRDGLQNEARILAPATRAELIRRLADTGVAKVETTSFVNPARVPQMAGAEKVVDSLPRESKVGFGGLVLNKRGYERLRQTPLDEARFVVVATDTFSLRNANTTVAESIVVGCDVIDRARADRLKTSVVIGTAFGCPFEGRVDAGRVLDIAAQFVEHGVHEVVFADTIGVAVPRQVHELVGGASTLGVPIGLHLHDTRNTAVANAYAGLEVGASVFEGSVGGIGGCPFSPQATGNVATEDLIYLLEGEGVESGVDLEGLISTARWLVDVLGHPMEGHLHRAGPRPAPSRTAEVASGGV